MRRSESKVIEFAERKLIPPRHILVVDDSERDVYQLEFAFVQSAIPHTRSYLIDGVQAINYLSHNPLYADRMGHGHIKPTTFAE